MKIFEFHCDQLLATDIEEIFAFFCDAQNLESITPPWLKFEVLTPAPIELGEGALIDYRLRVRGIPLRWQSKITHWDPPHSFVDEQLRGPYRLWIHTHTFEERDGGVLAGDHVKYAVPGGALMNNLLVRRDVEKIFEYRQKELAEIFS